MLLILEGKAEAVAGTSATVPHAPRNAGEETVRVVGFFEAFPNLTFLADRIAADRSRRSLAYNQMT